MSKKILTSTNPQKEFRERLVPPSEYKPVDIPDGYSDATKIPVDERILKEINAIGRIGPKKKVVIHATSGNSKLSDQDEYLLWNCNWGGTKWTGYKNGKPDVFDGNKRNSLTHYTVFGDGQIAQHARETQWLQHVMKDNSDYIGIEHHFRYTKETPTKEMYIASAKLVKDICERNGIDLSDPSQVIVQHDPNADPGKYWDWNYYFKLLKDNTYSGTPLSKEGIDAFLDKNTGKTEKDIKYMHPNPALAPGKKKQESTQDKQGEESDYTNEDIENGILAYFLPEIVEYRRRNVERYNNIMYFDTGDETPFFNNLLFAKNLRSLKDYNKLTNLEISNLIPFAELYLIQEKREVLFPFDDYTNKAKLENILNDPTSRGGNIGIKKVSWNSLATNNDNLAQFTVKVSFLIQDIEEIEKKRNGISLLDFLYPAGSRDPNVYNAKNHNIKMKAGWRFKKNRTTEGIESKITEKLLQETIYLSLYKHSFEFDEKDGTVTLDIEYIGMTETEASNIHEKNILDETNFITGETSTELKAWKNILEEYVKWIGAAGPNGPKETDINSHIDIEKAKAVKDGEQIKFAIKDKEAWFFKNDTYDMSDREKRQECRENIKEKIESLKGEVKNEKAGTFRKLLKELNDKYALQKIILTPEEVDFFKSISHSSTQINKRTKESLTKVAESVNNSLKGNRKAQTDLNRKISKGESLSNEEGKIDLEKIKSLQSDGSLYINFIYLQDILHYLYKWVYGGIEDIWSETDSGDTRLCLGSFSYLTTNIAKTSNVNTGDYAKAEQNLEEKDGKLLRKFANEKRWANMGDIPISVKSFASWYNDKIIDGDIQKMSFHEMLKQVMYTLVPQNIQPQIFPWGPSVSFDPFIVYETTKKAKPLEDFFEKYKNRDPSKRIRTGRYHTPTLKGQSNPWQNFSSFKEQVAQKTSNSNNETINYIFITSKFEVNKKLKGNPNEDIKNNILHFYVGEDKGLVKNIKFKREDNRQLDAANIVKANKEQSKPMIIRQMYQLDMSMFGNTLFYPGNLIHITPSYPGSRLNNKTLYKIGLGGYYRILRLKHVLGQDGFTTNVEAKWEASGIDKLRKEDREILEVLADSSEEGGSSEGLQTEEEVQADAMDSTVVSYGGA